MPLLTCTALVRSDCDRTRMKADDSVSFNPEFGSLSGETPFTFFTSQCDTCGKTFAHSTSYRRHTGTQCDSQARKRRRKLWLPDESYRSDKDEGDKVAPLLNTVECETEGNINVFCPCLFPLLQGSISEQNLHMLNRP